jgi:phosphoribosylglycinamide formyltransferase-1
MANLAIFASGNGSNFQAIAEAICRTNHSLEFLLCNKKSAYVLERAKSFGITSYLVSYLNKNREDVEKEILAHMTKHAVDLVALAGFMKLLTPFFLSAFRGDILNIHPSLLPKYAGVHAIERSFNAGENEFGISIIKIDPGVDSGPILFQTSFERPEHATLSEIEEKIHELEHIHFPAVVINELDKIDTRKTKQSGGNK